MINNSLSLLLANGNALFLGMLLSMVAFVSNYRIVFSWQGGFSKVAAIGGTALVVFSSTPLPTSVYATWLLCFLLVFMESFLPEASRLRNWFMGGFVAVSLLICLSEAPYHFAPKIRVLGNSPVYIIGDSISAGVRSTERNWPEVLGESAHLRVTNLAIPGATSSSAQEQIEGIRHSNALVFVEIGGNDMLRGVPVARFRESLDALLSRLAGGNKKLVMFELPLFPLHSGYGETQRELAKKYDILLIPKKYMAAVIGADGGTIDGLHLSQQGHDTLAESVHRMLRIE